MRILLILTIFLFACNNNNSEKPQTDIDAVKVFKKLCNEGDFNAAKDFVANEDISKLKVLQADFEKLNKIDREELKNKSIVILKLNKIDTKNSVIVLKNDFSNFNDTIKVENKAGEWLVRLR